MEYTTGPPKKYAQRSTIQHWQLRDLVLCPTSKSQFLYVNGNVINFYNTTHCLSSSAFVDLAFSPTSVASGHGYLAAGGQRSQLMVRKLDSDWSAQMTVGGSINNALCISKHFDQTRLLICNNDETIKIYSLPDLARLATLTFPTAVNYASVSPDGKKMVVVGDTSQVYLYNISTSGNYEKVSTLTGEALPLTKASSDAGFSCSWNQSSEKFAVASQDGYVSVWDIRSTEKIAKISASQNPQVKGACRCVKFSPSGSMDLLAFSEHVSYVNIVDARNFNDRQAIRVTPEGNDQHISGISFSPDSEALFVGLEHSMLEFEIDKIGRRSFPQGSLL